MSLVPILVTDEQAKAAQKAVDLATTVVREGGQVARYIGKVLGTTPEDAVGLVKRCDRSSPSYRTALIAP
jgi:hypothetical protein